MNRLKEIEIQKISHDTYVQRYLKHLVAHGGYYIKIYTRVLTMSLSGTSKKIADVHLLDYGAGVGLLGIFAAYCGFGKVSINEREASFLSSAQVLAEHFGIKKNVIFLAGSLEKGFDAEGWGKPDLLVATDVIEHLYDLNEFLSCCKMLNGSMSMVFTTGSNPSNRRKVLALRKLQVRDEWEGNPVDNENKLAGYEHEAYRSMRKKIIQEQSSTISATDLEMLVERTRGLIRKEIEKKIIHFIETGEMPEMPSDPFNTCHPETGSWSERILSFDEYQTVFNTHLFSIQFTPGFYDSDKKGLKKIINSALNLFIPIFGMSIAPFIFIRTKNIHN